MHNNWFILPLLLPTPTTWLSLDHERNVRDGVISGVGRNETFWFLILRFRLAYDSTYDSDFLFLRGHKRSHHSAYDSDSESVASENQPLGISIRIRTYAPTRRMAYLTQFSIPALLISDDKQDNGRSVRHIAFDMFEWGLGQSDLWLVHGLVLMLVLMSTSFSLVKAQVRSCLYARYERAYL